MQIALTLKNKIIVIYFVCVLPLTLAVGFVVYQQEKQLVDEIVDAELHFEAVNLANDLQSVFIEYQQQVRLLASHPLVAIDNHADFPQRVQSLLKLLGIPYTGQTILVVERDGRMVERYIGDKQISVNQDTFTQAWFDAWIPPQGLLDVTGRIALTHNYFYWQQRGFLLLASPLLDSQAQSQHFLVVAYDLSQALSPLMGETLDTDLLSRYGQVQAVLVDPSDNVFAGERLKGGSVAMVKPLNWGRVGYRLEVMLKDDISVVMLAPQRWLIALTFILLLAVQVLMLGLIGRSLLLNRIRVLNEAAKKFALGDFSVRVSTQGKDEISDLAIAFNGMFAEVAQAQLYLKKMVDVRTHQANESKERLQAILATVGEAIISIDVNGIILSFNQSAEKIFGFNEQEIVGKSVNTLMPLRHATFHDKHIEGCVDGVASDVMIRKLNKDRTIEARRKSGETFPVSIRINRGISKSEVFFTGVIEDLTEQVATKKKLAEKEQLLHTAIHHSSQSFVISTIDDEIIEANSAFCLWLGYSLSELMGMSLEALSQSSTVSDSGEQKNTLSDSTFANNSAVEKQYICKNGDLVWGLLSSTVVKDSEAKPMFLVSQIMPIEEQKRMSIELEKRNMALERSNADLDKFAYVASHDLKSPLNAIKKIVSWIEEDTAGKLSETSSEYIQLLKSRTDRMVQLLNDLLLYSRVGRIHESYEQVDVKPLAESIFDILDKPTAFTLRVDSEKIFVPRIPFELVLRNLISNAIKHHHRQDGHVHIQIDTNAKFNVIRVDDDGPGIAPELQLKAFEMFQTLKSRDQVEGSGIGLTLVKKTVEHYGGSIRIQSDGQSGTTLIVRWPVGKELDEVEPA